MSIPPPVSLGDGIHLIPAPLPFASPGWVNTYAIEAGNGLLLLDCGTDWDPGRKALSDGFRQLGLDESSVHTLVVTHLHLDHVGMSARLVREWGCRFVMHQNAAKLVERYNDMPGYVQRLLGIGRRFGIPQPILEALPGQVGDRPDYMPIIEPPDHTVEDGDTIDLGNGRSLEVVHTPGHESAHICLRDDRTGIFFSGDHVLPRISPVIMYDEALEDPLGAYLGSLRKLHGMDIGVTYPAHGALMERGDDRIRQIVLHHDRRLVDMRDLVRGANTTAWDVMLRSFRPNLTPLETRLAFLETVSHLEHLRLGGRIRHEDRDGVVVYTR